MRTFVHRNGHVSYGVGGGIVYDSDAEAEYEETLDKSRAFVDALGCDIMKLPVNG
ncbi:MAG: chorismate-binding protein [Candidatus Omnitrophica bacterium]|nr:chorismate-binding protein [Candidatus Omnitrophota bacterium]